MRVYLLVDSLSVKEHMENDPGTLEEFSALAAVWLDKTEGGS